MTSNLWALTYIYKPGYERAVFAYYYNELQARAEAARLEVLGQKPQITKGRICWEDS